MKTSIKSKRTLGITLLILGIAMFLFANYIAQQVIEGKQKISTAQKQVDTGDSLLSLSPYTEDVGKFAKGEAQGKIDAGNAEVRKYELVAKWLHIGGVIIALGGVYFLILSFRKK